MPWSSAVRILVIGTLMASILSLGIMYLGVNNQGSLLLQIQSPHIDLGNSISSQEKDARDARRKADLAAIEAALELHYQRYGAYTQPENMCTDTSYGGNVNSKGGCTASGTPGDWHKQSDLRDIVRDGFIARLPVDPINNSTYKYWYEPGNAGEKGYTKSGQFYTLCAKLELSGNYCIRKNK